MLARDRGTRGRAPQGSVHDACTTDAVPLCMHGFIPGPYPGNEPPGLRRAKQDLIWGPAGALYLTRGGLQARLKPGWGFWAKGVFEDTPHVFH